MNLFRRSTQTAVAMFLLISISACSGLFNFTPERAIAAELLSQRDGQVNQDTIQILQKVEFNGNTMILVSYQQTRDNRVYDCLALHEVIQYRSGWRVGSGGGGCSSGTNEDRPFSVSAGTSQNNERAYSEVDGLVFEPEITEIEVLWADGEVQRVEVINSSYLVLRSGIHEYETIQAYNKDGEIIDTFQLPEPAPGKEHLGPN